MGNILYFFDNVVIKLKLLQTSKRFQILYFPDILIKKIVTQKRKRKDFDFTKVNILFGNDFILIQIIFDGFSTNKIRLYVRMP
mgnify:CR=1 FL=1